MVKIGRALAKTRPTQKGARVFLVRHGKTRLNAGAAADVDKIRGWMDVPLDKEGEAEAEQLADLFEHCPVAAVYTGDLKRQRITGEEIAAQLKAPVYENRALRPWNLGVFQGKPSKDVIPWITRYARDAPNVSVPEGESFAQFRDRFLGFLQEVLAKSREGRGAVIMVGSYRNMKTTEGWLAAGGKGDQIDLPTFFRDDIGPGAILEICPTPDGWKGHMLFRGFGPHVKTG